MSGNGSGGAGHLKTCLAENLVFKLVLTATGTGLSLYRQIDNPDPSRSRRAGHVSSPQCFPGDRRSATAILSAQDNFRSTRPRS